MELKMVKYVPIEGSLTLKTGLRIGGSKEELDIGGMDNPVIRHPLTGVPYIPGSSLKGKLRSLLEYKTGNVAIISRFDERTRQTNYEGKPCDCAKDECLVCRVFGTHSSKSHKLGPTRIIVRDAMMTEEWISKLNPLTKDGLLYVESKTETWIDRQSGKAGTGGLRSLERVPAGTVFDFNISVRIFKLDEKKEQEILSFIEQGFEMLKHDTLGGSGTRGYGWVEIDYKIKDHILLSALQGNKQTNENSNEAK